MVFLLQLTLDVVNEVVHLQQIRIGRHLSMEGHHSPAGAVVVIDQIMDPQNIFMGEHQLVDIRSQFRVHRPPQKRIQGVFGGLPAGFQNKDSYQQTGKAVNFPLEEMSHQSSQKNHAGSC